MECDEVGVWLFHCENVLTVLRQMSRSLFIHAEKLELQFSLVSK